MSKVGKLQPTFPKWPAALRQDRVNLPAEQAFLPREVSAVAEAPEVGRIKPRTRIIMVGQSVFGVEGRPVQPTSFGLGQDHGQAHKDSAQN